MTLEKGKSMSKPAVAANKIKELEAVNTDQQLTIVAQSEEIVNQLNTILTLRKELTAVRSQLNGSPAQTGNPTKPPKD